VATLNGVANTLYALYGVEVTVVTLDDVAGRAGRLRRGCFVILPPPFWFVWRIPIVTRNVGDE
jgi:hypothetical protein